MNTVVTERNRDLYDTPVSTVAWPAIIAGALTAAAVSLILLLLGSSALGFAPISPWSNAGITFTTFTVTTAIWLFVMQLTASGLGGYLTGRLRHRWMNVHSDEVFFRDTAHGFLTWSLATLITVACLASATTSVVSGGVKAATTVTAMTAAGAGYSAAENASNSTMDDATAYLIDGLYRSNQSDASADDVRVETTRIFAAALKDGTISNADRNHLTQLVSKHTGLSGGEASNRVNDVFAKLKSAKEKAKKELDDARKLAAKVALYGFLSLLMGAFAASVAAVFGGRDRDRY